MRIEHGDMREVLARLIAEGVVVQSVITDPPYGLGFMGKRWDAADNVAFQYEAWRLCFELLPPGGHLVAFGGTRTYHRMACLAEGFDCILVEREAEYVADIRRRLAHVKGEDTPLFSRP